MNRFNHNQNFFLTVDRLTFLSLGIFLLAVGIIVRLFWLQIIEHSKYQAMAQNQHLLEQELLPNRGEIYIHDYQTSQDSLFQVAVNKKFYLVIAIPNLVKNFKSYAKLLAPILEMDEQILINHLDKKNDVYGFSFCGQWYDIGSLDAYKEAQKLLLKHKAKLDEVARVLLEKENLDQDEFAEIMKA